MKTAVLAYCLLLTWLDLSAQDSTKGLSIVSQKKETTGTTRALIVGISTYQHIPSLDYADSDAKEFARFLQSNNSWQVSNNKIKLLTNEQAKAGDIIAWLTWLLETSKQGDKIVFYFSGHGDVETSKDINKGYLLAFDSPKNNYVTGAISVDLLREIYTEMIDKGIRLYMITDACRAGHLAGGSAGSKITAEAFSKQWRNEIKILSAQPDELSYEGSQWGGGRGVFSFFLTKGLSGYADVNKDSSITLAELEQYVGLNVSQETSFKQQPVFEGANKYSSRVAAIDTLSMTHYSQYKSGDIAVMVVTGKGDADIETGECEVLYSEFMQQLNSISDSASVSRVLNSYQQINNCNSESLKNTARYQVTAALLNYVQQVVNQTLIGQKLIAWPEIDEALSVIDNIYKINAGRRLVNQAHLDNIRRFLVIHNNSLWSDKRLTAESQLQLEAMLDTALTIEPGAAYLELTKGILFMNKEEYGAALFHFKRSIEYSPTWLMAYYYAAQALEMNNKPAEAVTYLEKVLQLDTAFQSFECAKCFYNMLGELMLENGEYEKAEQYLLKALELDSSFSSPTISLVQLYHLQKKAIKRDALISKLEKRGSSLEEQLLMLMLKMELGLVTKKESLNLLDKIDTLVTDDDMGIYYNARIMYSEKFNPGDLMTWLRNVYDLDPGNFVHTEALLEELCTKGYFEEAEDVINSVTSTLKSSQRIMLQYYKAIVYAYTEREQQAFELFKPLVKEGYIDCKELKVMKPLKKVPGFSAFIKNCK